jgi:hypothetical protein
MATAIAVQEINGAYLAEGAAGQLSTVTWAAADTTGNTITMPGQRVLLLFRNSGASTRTVAITSSADPYGRKADIAATNIAAGAIFAKVLEPRGWEQTLGGRDLLVTANHAEVLIAAIAL